jgi:hypothetical protein
MKEKTDGQVGRFLTKRVPAEDRSLEQWFLVAIGDNEKAKEAVSTISPKSVLNPLASARREHFRAWRDNP